MTKTLTEYIGQRIRELRTERKVRLDELSFLSGVGISTLSNLENGKRDIRLSTLERILNALQAEPANLFASTNEKAEPPIHLTDDGYDLDD